MVSKHTIIKAFFFFRELQRIELKVTANQKDRKPQVYGPDYLQHIFI